MGKLFGYISYCYYICETKLTDMKLLVLFLLITVSTFGQDSLLFDYVNEYRVANGVVPLVYDSELHIISKVNTINMFLNDSLMHSGTNTYECVTRQFTLASTQSDLDSFNKFLGDYYGDSYSAPLGGTDDPSIIDYALLYIVYSWHSSPPHRGVLLSKDVSVGSCNVRLGEITYKSNYKTVGGKKFYFNKFISHFKIDAIATLNLNI